MGGAHVWNGAPLDKDMLRRVYEMRLVTMAYPLSTLGTAAGKVRVAKCTGKEFSHSSGHTDLPALNCLSVSQGSTQQITCCTAFARMDRREVQATSSITPCG